MDPDPFRILLDFIVLDGTLVLKIVVLILLLLCSALISGAEVAFFGLSGTDVHGIDEEKTAKGAIVVKLLDKPKKLLATILIANNAINIAIVLLFTALGDVFFADINYQILDFISVRFLLEVVVVTFLILMFGEILPKVYANRNQKTFAITMAFPLKVLDFFIYAIKFTDAFCNHILI